MKISLVILAMLGVLSPCFALAETDWLQVDDAIGKKATVVGSVHRYGLPRADLQVTLDGVTIKPALALGGWIAFEPSRDGAMMMGDLVLTETELNPVMRSLLSNGVVITAVHNHLLRATPAPFYMHICSYGDPLKLAKVVRNALSNTKIPFAPSVVAVGELPKIEFNTAQVDEILDARGKNNGGVYQFSIPLAETIKADGEIISPAMGVAHVINFQPTGEGKAAVAGDMVVTAKGVEPLLKTLQSSGIEVTALHSHMLDEEPRLLFIHFWSNADAILLAKGLKAALDKSSGH